MASHHLVLLVAIVSVATAFASSADTLATAPTPAVFSPEKDGNSSQPTAYEMLEKFKLPQGILPQGVTSYVLNQDGSFEVHLPSDCNIRAGGMGVRYSSVITGSISSQSIHGLQGVRVKELFLWITIDKVDATDDGQLHFVAGAISKSFPVDKFANSPTCN